MAKTTRITFVIFQSVPTMKGMQPSGKNSAKTTSASINSKVFGLCIRFFPGLRACRQVKCHIP